MIGKELNSFGTNNVIVGRNDTTATSQLSGNENVNIGINNDVRTTSANNNVIIGSKHVTSSGNNITLGHEVSALKGNNLVIGRLSHAIQPSGTVIGYNNSSTGSGSVIIGENNRELIVGATGVRLSANVIFGSKNTLSGGGGVGPYKACESVVIGRHNNCNGYRNITMGSFNVNRPNNVSIGYKNLCSHQGGGIQAGYKVKQRGYARNIGFGAEIETRGYHPVAIGRDIKQDQGIGPGVVGGGYSHLSASNLSAESPEPFAQICVGTNLAVNRAGSAVFGSPFGKGQAATRNAPIQGNTSLLHYKSQTPNFGGVVVGHTIYQKLAGLSVGHNLVTSGKGAINIGQHNTVIGARDPITRAISGTNGQFNAMAVGSNNLIASGVTNASVFGTSALITSGRTVGIGTNIAIRRPSVIEISNWPHQGLRRTTADKGGGIRIHTKTGDVRLSMRNNTGVPSAHVGLVGAETDNAIHRDAFQFRRHSVASGTTIKLDMNVSGTIYTLDVGTLPVSA